MSGEYLGEKDYNEIAQWVSALDFESQVLGIPGGFKTNEKSFGWQSKNYYTAAWNKVAAIGYYDQAKGGGTETFQDILSLRYLLSKGKIGSKEADAYLRLKYPDQKWGSGAWKKKSGSEANQKATDKSAKTNKDGTKPKASEIASTAAGSGGSGEPFSGSAAYGSTSSPSVVLDQLPDAYTPESLGEVIEGVSTQLSAQIAAVASGRGLRLAPGSLSGKVLTPGSIPASALSPIDLENVFVSAPQPDDAIRLQVSRSSSADRWATTAGVSGPGRIWQATTARFPSGWKPRSGMARYRIPLADLQFGVMSILMRTDSWSGAGYVDTMEVRYGVVIQGIPNTLGRPPMSIRFAQYGQDAPSQMAYQFIDGGFAGDPPWSGTKSLMESKIDAIYRTAAKPAWEVYDLSTADGTLSPTSSMLESIQGVSVSLITADTSEGVWQQLNTRQCYAGAHLAGAAHGPTVTCPDGLEMAPPCPPSAIDWDGGAGLGAQYDHLSTTAAASANRLVQGVPIILDDCSRLRALSGSFALVVQIIGHEPSNVTGTWGTPAEWYEHGVRAPLAQARDWTLDVVIE